MVPYLSARPEPGEDIRLMRRAREDGQPPVADGNNRVVCTVPCVATARTRDAAGGAMREKLAARVGREVTKRPELFEMGITPDEWDRELIEQ